MVTNTRGATSEPYSQRPVRRNQPQVNSAETSIGSTLQSLLCAQLQTQQSPSEERKG